VAEKLAEKKRILTALRREAHYRRPLNNATLASFKNYHSGTPELDALLTACGSDWKRFLDTLAVLKDEPLRFHEPNQRDLGPVVNPLVQAGCPAKPTH
jgi:predicted aminopeptidase